jgi:hypothetical protein
LADCQAGSANTGHVSQMSNPSASHPKRGRDILMVGV